MHLTLLQNIELTLIASGAFAYAHLVHARSASARAVWYNRQLFAFALSWSAWFALTFISLNLETRGIHRVPVLSAGLDALKGGLLCLQAPLLVHGLARLTGRRGDWRWVYAPPILLILVGSLPVLSHPQSTFLQNVDPLVLGFLAMDVAYTLLALVLLTAGFRRLTSTARPILAALLPALTVLALLLALSTAMKAWQGPWSHAAFYTWVLPFDLGHQLIPIALLIMAYRTHSVALDVTVSAWRRAAAFAMIFPLYLVLKSRWPDSWLDRTATFTAIALGLPATIGPLWLSLLESFPAWLNLGMRREALALLALQDRLLDPTRTRDDYLEFARRSLSLILGCRAELLPPDDPRAIRLLVDCGVPDSPATPTVLSVLDATSRHQVAGFEELGARLALPLYEPREGRRSLVALFALGPARTRRHYPSEIRARLRAVQGILHLGLEARAFVSGRLEAERRLQEQERLALLGMMAASAAHEIKNPLSAIRNVAAAARHESDPGSVLSRDLDVIVGEVDRLDGTVRRMLHFARERGTTENVIETAEAVCGLMRVQARQKRQTIAMRPLPGAPVRLPLSENDLKAVLFNLVLNAIEHAPEGAEIAVEIEAEPPSVRVANPGEIPEDFRGRLFEPLASRGGTGLGLYISRGKIRESGGDLRYEPGSGETAFRLVWETP